MNTLNNKFIGEAKKANIDDLTKIAQFLGIELAVLRAVVEVEAASSGFYSIGAPVMLYEPHIAYRYSTGTVKAELVKAGLAYYRWGTKPYPKSYIDRYAQLEKAINIAGPKAYEFASYGLPQMMGFNYKICKFESAEDMFKAFKESEANQLLAMAVFITANTAMHKALINKDWAGFALRYNGKGYKANKYDTKLAAAYARYKKDPAVNLPPVANGTLSIGSKGPEVVALQNALNKLGYGPLVVDGHFGKITLQSVDAYLKDNNLNVVDVVVVSLQKAIINAANAKPETVFVQPVPEIVNDENVPFVPVPDMPLEVEEKIEESVETLTFWQKLRRFFSSVVEFFK